MGEDVRSSVISFLEGERLPIGMANAFLVLIPKINKPESIKQFRPISLCNVMFKLVTKVIVNRLKEIMEDLVSPNLCNFVPRRQIRDNIIIRQELIDTLKHQTGKCGGMVIKIDLEKSYDQLEWHFIKETLTVAGLPQHLVESIMECVSNARCRLVWNDECMKAIYQTRGIKQGVPISPYMFVLCLERIDQPIQKEVDEGHWRPLRASCKGPDLSHFIFC